MSVPEAMTSSRTPYHQPVRKPAQETLEKLLVAAEEQLREQELDAFTVQNVLQRAGLSVGAFYSRFPDKTAILHEVQERVHTRIDGLIQADLAAKQGSCRSLEEAVDESFGILIRHVFSERELFRAFMMLSVFDQHMRQKGEQMNWDRQRAVAKFLEPHFDEIGHDDPHHAIDSAYAIYSSSIRGRLVLHYGLPKSKTQFGVTDDELCRDLKKALAQFLAGDPPKKPSSP